MHIFIFHILFYLTNLYFIFFYILCFYFIHDTYIFHVKMILWHSLHDLFINLWDLVPQEQTTVHLLHSDCVHLWSDKWLNSLDTRGQYNYWPFTYTNLPFFFKEKPLELDFQQQRIKCPSIFDDLMYMLLGNRSLDGNMEGKETVETTFQFPTNGHYNISVIACQFFLLEYSHFQILISLHSLYKIGEICLDITSQNDAC